MKRPALFVAASFAALPLLYAQDDKKKAAAPEPQVAEAKVKEHEALKAFAGTWEVTGQMTAPGADKPGESKATERAELICNGLWVKSVVNGQLGGQPLQGLYLLGYDPGKKTYTGYWFDNQDPAPSSLEGSYDEKTKTWSFSGKCSTGQMKSTIVQKDADTMLETCVSSGSDGKESKMEMTHRRVKALPADASASSAVKAGKAPSKEHAELLRGVGEWQASMKLPAVANAPAVEPSSGTEKCVPVCDARYLWSDFQMDMMGQPFEGHAVCGYDATQKKYVSYWIDSSKATISPASGTYDPSTKTSTMTVTSIDHGGKPVATKQVITWKDDNTRVMKMEDAEGQGFEITFTRKK